MKIKLLTLNNIFKLIIIVLVSQSFLYAQPGTIDLTFNSNDTGFRTGDDANSIVWTNSIQNDGKIVIGGNFSSYNGTSRNRIARLNEDGTLDHNFITGTGLSDVVYTTSIQSDGKILVGGNFTSYNGTTINRIVRLNSDGSIDNSFNPGLGANSIIYSISIQNDGKIVVAGSFTTFNGISKKGITRLNTNGTIDASFNVGTGININSSIRTTSIQSDGKIIIGGSFSIYNGVSVNRLARLNIDGTIDSTFNLGTGPNNDILTSLIQNNGKILLGGKFNIFNNSINNFITRINIDGSVDNTFNTGTGFNNFIYSLTFQNNEDIIVGGDFTTYNGNVSNRLARISNNGNIDLSFLSGTALNSSVYSISTQNDNKIIIGGDFTSYDNITRNRIVRLNSNGTLDSSFNLYNGSNNLIKSICFQDDGKIIVSGSFTTFNGVVRNRIARLNIDGTLDLTFNPGTGADSPIETTLIQSDGKIIIGGYFSTYNNISRKNIARLNIDGSLDMSFNPGTTSTNGVVNSCAIESDGKIIIGGTMFRRLNTDGTLNANFDSLYGLSGIIYSISIQSNGKIVVAGNFPNNIARANINGTWDTSFNIGTGASGLIWTTKVQSDDKIVIGGQFSSYNGVLINRIARLNSNGTIDSTFNPGSGANDYILTSSLQSDGKIIIGGRFTSYNGSNRNYIARLNNDGTQDLTFNPGLGCNDYVYSTIVGNNDKIIIGGSFTSYNNIGRNRITRINGNNLLNNYDFEEDYIFIYPNPNNGSFNIQTNNESEYRYVYIYSVLGQLIFKKEITNKETIIDITGQPKGIYFYNLLGDNGKYKKSGKVVLE